MKLSSQNKRILVLSDIHQEVDKANRIIKAESADLIVNLGDEFDSFYKNSDYDVIKTCQFLTETLHDDKFHTLWGNHDLAYFYPSNHTLCSGYTTNKMSAIDKIFGPLKNDLAKKFKWHIQIDDFLCTHAGVSDNHLPPCLDLKNINEWLDEEAEAAKLRLNTDQSHWFYGAGKSRGGRLNKGGIVWLDFNNEFQPIKRLKQIFGHTYGKVIRGHRSDIFHNPNDWNNICIDCNLNQYLIISDGKIEVKNYTA